jgi:hypothetical protein
MSYLLTKHNKNNVIVNCDAWLFEGAKLDENIPETGISYVDYKNFVRQSYVRNVNMFMSTNLPWTYELLSDDFFEIWSKEEKTDDIFNRKHQLGGPISFCYIDGNHSYEYALRDFNNCHNYLETGGYILFDDSADGSNWGVCHVVKDVVKRKDYRLLMKNPNYLVQKID